MSRAAVTLYTCDGPRCGQRWYSAYGRPPEGALYPPGWRKAVLDKEQYDFCSGMCFQGWAKKEGAGWKP